MTAGSSAQIILLPVYRRQWVFACKSNAAPASSAADGTLSSRVSQWLVNTSQRVGAFPARPGLRQETGAGSVMDHVAPLPRPSLRFSR